MMDNPGSSQAFPRPARLNPFAFPSDTNLRFILLLACVLGACLWIYSNSPLWQTPKEFIAPAIARFDCSKTSGEANAIHEIATKDPKGEADFERAQPAYAQCIAPLALQDVLRMLSGLGLLVGIAVIMYLVFPLWKRWRKQLVPLPIEEVPAVMTELTSLCREVGLVRQPQFVWNPLDQRSEGLAFGHMGRYFVALTGGLVNQFYTDLHAFRAIIRHELAHLRNADIDKTYFSVAVWWAFLATSVIPFVISLLRSFSFEEGPFYFNISLRILALALLVLLTRNAVLRAREIYADVRASTWDGPMGALQRVLENLSRSKHRYSWNMVQSHPDPEKRQIALKDTQLLFQMGFWVAFGTGIAATISFEGVNNFFSLLAQSLQYSFPSPVAAGLIFGVLATGVVGSGVWRATFAAFVQGKMSPDIRWLAIGMTLGVVGGYVLSLSLSLVGADLPTLNTLGSFLAFWAIWSLLLLLSLLLVLRWIIITTLTWLEVTVNRSTLRRFSRISLIIVGGTWAVCFGFLSFAGTIIVPTNFSDIVSLLALAWMGLTLLAQPLVLIGLMGIWLVPLVAWFWRKHVVTPAEVSWAWLDQIPQQQTFHPQQPFHLRLALFVGIAGGLLFCGLWLAQRLWLHLTIPEAMRAMPAFKLSVGYWGISRSILIQVGTAVVVAAWARRLGGIYSLFATFIAVCIMTIGFLELNLLLGGNIDPLYTWIVFSSIAIPGGLLAVFTAPVVAALAKRLGTGLRTGIISGLAYSGFLFCVVIGMQFIFHESTRSASPLVHIVSIIGVGLTLLLPIGTGAMVSARVSPYGLWHGLFAAFTTGCIEAGSLLLLPTGSSSPTINAVNLGGIIVWGLVGSLLALPGVLIVAMIVRHMHHSR